MFPIACWLFAIALGNATGLGLDPCCTTCGSRNHIDVTNI